MLTALWGCNEAQQYIELNANISMLIALTVNANMIMLAGGVL